MTEAAKKPLVIGLTGGIGSGKTAASDYFARQGIAVVDADQAARAVVAPGQPALDAIVKHFGRTILQPDNSLDRRQLRAIIFTRPEEKAWLEQLLHPKINALLSRQLAETHSAYGILVSPLLIESAQDRLVDRILVVDVPESVQLQRAMTRDHMSEAQARQIIRSQCSRAQRLSRADDIIDNSGTRAQLYQALARCHRHYLSLACEQG